MIANLLSKIVVGVVSTGLADYFIDGVSTDQSLKTYILVGTVIGLLLFFVRPVLKLITLPLRIITLNLFTVVIIMGLIWLTNVFFSDVQFQVYGAFNLLCFSLILIGTEYIIGLLKK